MFERFTDRARRVVVLAQEEARLLNHNHIGTEHLLLGLIHEGEGVAARALEALDIPLDAVRRQIEESVGRGETTQEGHIPFTDRAKKALELSLREALQLGHNYIGTEHILLGLIREGEDVAAQVLISLGADLSLLRQQVVELLSGYSGAPGLGDSSRFYDWPRRRTLESARRDFAELTEHGRAALALGQARATLGAAPVVTAAHVLLAICDLDRCIANLALRSAGVDPQQIADDLRAHIDAETVADDPLVDKPARPTFGAQVTLLVELASVESLELRHRNVGTEHQLLALTRHPSTTDFLRDHNVTHTNLRRHVLRALYGDDIGQNPPA